MDPETPSDKPPETDSAPSFVGTTKSYRCSIKQWMCNVLIGVVAVAWTVVMAIGFFYMGKSQCPEVVEAGEKTCGEMVADYFDWSSKVNSGECPSIGGG